jgi:erythritol transport system ATP-binding protein
VMSQGRLTALIDRADASEAKIVAASSIGHGPSALAQQKDIST